MSFDGINIGFIGAGAMAEALIKSIILSKVTSPAKIWASDISKERGQQLVNQYGINFLADNKELITKVEVIIYAVKPFILEEVLLEIAEQSQNHLHISIAAGISLDFIESRLPAGSSVVRVMPNTPCLIGAGASAYATGKAVSPQEELLVKDMMECTGVCVKVPERLMNAVTGLSGSGPAYVFLIIEALIDGGVKAGLPRDTAALLAVQTVLGAAKLVQETGKHPASLKDMVTTPGGTTITALHVLEKGNVRAALMDAVAASALRAEEMGAGK